MEVKYDFRASSNPIVIPNTDEGSLIGLNNEWIKRSFNSKLNTVILPDGTKIYTFKEKKMIDEENFKFNNVTIISRQDGTVLKVYQNGEFVILHSNERQNYNLAFNEEEEEGTIFEHKYLEYLHSEPQFRPGGIYTADLKNSYIWTRDHEGNYFEQYADGSTKHDVIYIEEPKSIHEMSEIIQESQRVEEKSKAIENNRSKNQSQDKAIESKGPKTPTMSEKDKALEKSKSIDKPMSAKQQEERVLSSKSNRPGEISNANLSNGTPIYDGSFYINEELNIPKTFVPPRLFVIYNKLNSESEQGEKVHIGYELLTESMVAPYKRAKEKVRSYSKT